MVLRRGCVEAAAFRKYEKTSSSNMSARLGVRSSLNMLLGVLIRHPSQGNKQLAYGLICSIFGLGKTTAPKPQATRRTAATVLVGTHWLTSSHLPHLRPVCVCNVPRPSRFALTATSTRTSFLSLIAVYCNACHKAKAVKLSAGASTD